ncbi:hypothetical protein N0V88_003510 [Collariella sp. IMI 366227]|nr:hypothetical protein N0V88_003510 [Collariella sp. IMI 366227]
MYNRARATAHQPRAETRQSAAAAHSRDTTAKPSPRVPSEARAARGPAAAATATITSAKFAAADHAAQPSAPHPANGVGAAIAAPDAAAGAAGTVRSTLLQPRVAVALGVSKGWYPVLFLCRLASIAPGVVFGLPNVLRLLATLHLMYLDRVLDGAALSKLGRGGGGGPYTSTPDPTFEARLRLTESLLASIWCFASGYLSFFFTDCLMSRWLLNYTPQGTIVRLLTVDAINGYVTFWVLKLTGGFEDPRLILPAWIVISTRKINIRKETSMSMSVFSIASFVSMVALLVQLHSGRPDYPDIPLLNFARRVFHEAGNLVIRLMEYGDITRDL